MSREVFVCTTCGCQGAEQWGYCYACGPCQVYCLDDWVRMQEAQQLIDNPDAELVPVEVPVVVPTLPYQNQQ